MFESLFRKTSPGWLDQVKGFCFVFALLFYGFIHDGHADYFEFVLDASNHYRDWAPHVRFNTWDSTEDWAIVANGKRLQVKGFSFVQSILIGRANFQARSVFQEGMNTFSVIFNGVNLAEIPFRVLYWNSQNRSQMICSGRLQNETQNLVDCGNVRMSLLEIDPGLAEEVEQYKREAHMHRQRALQPTPEEILANEQERQYEAERLEIERKIQALNQELSMLHFEDFDSIQPEQMSQLIGEDVTIGGLYEELKASVDHLRREIQQEVTTNEERTRQVEADLKRLFGEAFAEQKGFDAPVHEIPQTAGKRPTFQREDSGAQETHPNLHPPLNPIVDQTLHQLESALTQGDQSAFLGAFSPWSTYQKNMKEVLEKRSHSGPKLDELRRSQGQVLCFVKRHIDLDGFFHTAHIPEPIKRMIGTQIQGWSKESAQDLREELNQWQEELNQWQEELNPIQRRVFNHIEELGTALRRLSDPSLLEQRKDPIQEEARNILQTALSVSAEQLIHAARMAPEARDADTCEGDGLDEGGTLSYADESLLESQGSLKLALAMGDFLLGVSPVGAVRDLLEALSGVSLLSQEPLSLQDRSLTLVMGTMSLVPGVKPALKALKGIMNVGKRLRTTLFTGRGIRGVRTAHQIEEAAVQAERLIEAGGTVWSSIKATQPVYKGSIIPRSFELTVNTGKFWVHGNATEHIAEYAASRAKDLTPEAIGLVSQVQLASLKTAVETAASQGIKYGEIIKVAGWGLRFELPRNAGELPALIHALYK